jgi:hypothetical protein
VSIFMATPGSLALGAALARFAILDPHQMHA